MFKKVALNNKPKIRVTRVVILKDISRRGKFKLMKANVVMTPVLIVYTVSFWIILSVLYNNE